MNTSPFLFSLLSNSIIAFGIIITIFILRKKEDFIQKHISIITSFTVGILLYLVCIDFMHELGEALSPKIIGFLLLLGMISFYVLELFFHWHHCHDLDHNHDHENCSHDLHNIHDKNKNLMITNTLLHNMFHGVVIFSSFALSQEAGILLTIGIFLHALPQNIANYVMNHKNIKAVIMSTLGGIIGALLCYPFGNFFMEYQYFILGFVGGGLLYIALSDMLPTVNSHATTSQKAKHLCFILIGTLVMGILYTLIHYI